MTSSDNIFFNSVFWESGRGDVLFHSFIFFFVHVYISVSSGNIPFHRGSVAGLLSLTHLLSSSIFGSAPHLDSGSGQATEGDKNGVRADSEDNSAYWTCETLAWSRATVFALDPNLPQSVSCSHRGEWNERVLVQLRPWLSMLPQRRDLRGDPNVQLHLILTSEEQPWTTLTLQRELAAH